MSAALPEIWYRFEDKRYACRIDYDSDEWTSRLVVNLRKFEVSHHTKCGTWLKLAFKGKRFVLKDAIRRFACPSIDEALVSFRARKAKQIRIAQKRIADAEQAMRDAEKFVNKREPVEKNVFDIALD